MKFRAARCVPASWLLLLSYLLLPFLLLSCYRPDPEEIKMLESPCGDDTVSIAEVQGDGTVSDFVGQQVTIKGVVTYQDHGGGLFLESLTPDNSPGTSEAIYVASEALSHAFAPGSEVVLSGMVAELGEDRDSQTAIQYVTESLLCSTGHSLPENVVQLPLDTLHRESIENMRVSLRQALVITDIYAYPRRELVFSTGGILLTPTEVANPGSEAQILEADNKNRSIRVRWPTALPPLTSGSEVRSVTGVLGHDQRGKRLLAEEDLRIAAPGIEGLNPSIDGNLRIAVMNLHNYFNGNGSGSGFKSGRGARNADEFDQQGARIAAAVNHMQAHLLSVSELENDGFGPNSAAQSLINRINRNGTTWKAVDPGTSRIGADEITVGLFYRTDRVEPSGSAIVLNSPSFKGRTRLPLAQQFIDKDSGKTFLIIANHLKSKGGCPDGGVNVDKRDGQGCWNPVRTSAAKEIVTWVERLSRTLEEPNILITGDLNSYRQEDPIQIFREAGFTELIETLGTPPMATFSYFGQHGTLDYAFASRDLAAMESSGDIWRINTPWPFGMTLPEPWIRFSDHNPLVVDLSFSQRFTSN